MCLAGQGLGMASGACRCSHLGTSLWWAALRQLTTPPPLLPQHYAAAAGHLPTLELLLQVAPSSAAAQDEGEDSPLHAAAAAGLPDAVRLLMAAAPGAVTSPGRTGLTPIELALGSNTLQHTTGAQRQAAARLLLAAAPAGDLLPALQRAGRERGWPLIPDAVALHLPLSEDDWDLVRCWLWCWAAEMGGACLQWRHTWGRWGWHWGWHRAHVPAPI